MDLNKNEQKSNGDLIINKDKVIYVRENKQFGYCDVHLEGGILIRIKSTSIQELHERIDRSDVLEEFKSNGKPEIR